MLPDVSADLLHATPGRGLDLIATLPQWLQMVLASVLVVTFCAPRLLRAPDDHLFNRAARRNIQSGSDWVEVIREVIRIRNDPRQLLGRRSTSSKASPDESPDKIQGAGGSSDAADQPP